MIDTLPFDADLLRRYDRPGPRYTSYPTAPQFQPGFGEAELRDAARRAMTTRSRAACRCTCTCRSASAPASTAAATASSPATMARAGAYLERLMREIELTGAAVRPRPRGDPAALRRRHAELPRRRPARRARGHAATAISTSAARRDRDFSIELDPRFVKPDDIAALADMGFNRASLGVQDFDPDGAAGGQPHPERRARPWPSSTPAGSTASARSTWT